MPFLVIGGVDLIALVVGLAALLVLAALWVFAKPIKTVLNMVPIPGIHLGDYFDSGLKVAVQSVAGVLDGMLAGVGHLFTALSLGVWHLTYKLVGAIGVVRVLALQALNVAAGAVTTAEAFTSWMVTVALSTVRGWVDDAIYGALVLFNTAMAAIDAGLSDVVHLAQHLYNLAVAYADAVGAYAVGVAQILYADAVSLIRTVESDVISEANDLFGTAERDIAAVAGALDWAVGAIQGEITGIQGQLGTLEQDLPLILAVPGLISAVTAITTDVTECLDPLCNTVTPRAPQLGKLGQFLQGLESLGLDVAIAAMFTAAVTDPAGTADEVRTVMGGLADPIVVGVRDLTGL